ncbi:complement factor H [Grus americana]|nr:complement factor H [Grus americana]XP_054689182.1 complement factor H [Grus americana]XP_054689183.1 complement factor H [Grus americana]
MSFLGYTALFLCWMYCTAERACEEPPPRRVKEVPTERWDKPPYPHGTQVTYRCRPGYIKLGRIVFKCVDGAWKQHPPGAECRNKPCGHPGDTEFGYFELTSGSEFVFGARVEYRCNDGYQMLSQRNYRECQADGWSNDIPHCEVAKCLPVKAPANGRIIMTGAFELDREYSFGQVVNFECNAKYKLVGLKEIICSSNGKWNSDVPQCQEIICGVPEIPHGYVRSPKQSYKDSEQLLFACDEGYRYGERADVRCTESGWNPTPSCTEIVCSPPRIPNGSFRPQEANYIVGDTITIQCNPGYHFKILTGRSTAECTKNGWVPDPSCVQKPCDYPAIENGKLSERLEYYKNYYFPMRFGQHADYHCNNGYSTPSGEYWVRMVCSERGWSPEPKCLKNCHVRQLQNGYFAPSQKSVYTEGERVKYACYADYRTEHEDGEVTCTKDGWSPPPRCIRKKKCQTINFDNGYFTLTRRTFNLQEVVSYSCHIGFVTPEGQETGVTRCQENGWTPSPKCIKSCKTPHLEILNYHTNKTMFMPEDTIEYTCLEGYQTANNMPTGTTRCGINGEWIPTPRCLAIECEMLTLPNGDFSPKEGKYRNGDVVKFTCGNNYVRVGPASAQCYYFGWFPSPPVCKANTRGCGPPPEITNGSIAGGSVDQYRHGDRKQYECHIEFKLVGSKEIECVDGQWSSPPSCIEDKVPCGSPSSIPNVVLHQEDQTQFSHGDEVICGCKKGSGNSEEMKIKCLNGEWKPLPLCADPSPQCVLPMDVELVHNGRPSRTKKKTFRGVIQYRCTSADKSIKQATCVSGKWLPGIECTAEENTCPPPPQVPSAQQITDGRNYKHGSKIAFSCLKSFQLIGVKEITCIEGKWQSPPYCVERPCLPPQPVECADVPQLENQNLKIEKEGKTIYLAGAKFKYVSRSGYMFNGSSEITCSMGNWTSAPACLEMPCGSIPKVANAQIEGRNKKIYEPGETIRYQCDVGFLSVGSPEIICREGNWTAPPFCEDVSCGAAPEIPNAFITSTQQDRYLPGASVQYECERNFQMVGGDFVTCTNGEWSRAPTCRDVTCEPPPEIAGGNVQGVKKSRYLPGESAHYQCWQGFQMTGASTIVCQNGTWTELPQCKGKGGKCGPPPVIENGDLLSFPMKEYSQGTTLEYKCPSLYVLEGSQYISCTNGQWTSPPVCLVACTAAEEDMGRNNIELKWIVGSKLYSRSGDFIEFRCKRGYVKDPASSPFRVQCTQGTLEYPWCKPGKNCTLDERTMKSNNIQLRSSRWSSTSTYYSGDYIFFECGWWYRPVSRPEKFSPECLDGVIKYPTCERRW